MRRQHGEGEVVEVDSEAGGEREQDPSPNAAVLDRIHQSERGCSSEKDQKAVHASFLCMPYPEWRRGTKR